MSNRKVTRARIDPPGNREFAAEAPVDDDFPASLDLRFRRKEFASDASDDVGSLEAIGVDPGQRDQERRPGHGRRGERARCRSAAPNARRTGRARAEATRRSRRWRTAGGSAQTGGDSCGVRSSAAQRDRQNRDGQDEAHQLRRRRAATWPPRAVRDRASVRRWSSPAMTASRSGSLIVAQAAISSHRAAAADAQSRQRIEDADVDAGRGDGGHGPSLKRPYAR